MQQSSRFFRIIQGPLTGFSKAPHSPRQQVEFAKLSSHDLSTFEPRIRLLTECFPSGGCEKKLKVPDKSQ